MSLALLRQHRELWAHKPQLRQVYAPWFACCAALLPSGAAVLEVGAGPGHLGEWVQGHRPDLRWIASDLIAAPWNHLAANALQLPFATGAVDAVVGIDTIHHLADPRAFFLETARIMRSGGCLVAVEPWVSPFSYPIYRWLHQEGCRPIANAWDPFGLHGGQWEKEAFDGNAAVVSRLVTSTAHDEWIQLGWMPPTITRLNTFAYLLSLGFRRWTLLPRRLTGAIQRIDRALEGLSWLLAMRVVVQWQRDAKIR